MGQKEVDELRQLIRSRADILRKMKTAKGKKLQTLTTELEKTQRRISVLDEKQN